MFHYVIRQLLEPHCHLDNQYICQLLSNFSFVLGRKETGWPCPRNCSMGNKCRQRAQASACLCVDRITSEGHGLEPMIEGLVKRYATAEVLPPHILYVDRDCSSLAKSFAAWPDLVIRLDIWHFMRSFASCVTEAHPLYGVFMSRMARCLFQ